MANANFISKELGVYGSGIESPGESMNNGPKEYFNLQGVKVDAEALRPGIYIERSSRGSRKVFIR